MIWAWHGELGTPLISVTSSHCDREPVSIALCLSFPMHNMWPLTHALFCISAALACHGLGLHWDPEALPSSRKQAGLGLI